jgi:hypothetical protein
MASKEPWELFPDIWKNQTAFFTYLRGHLRLLWSRYPAKLKWKSAQLVKPPKGYTGRAKSLGICHYCKNSFAASHLEVDHVQRAGSCNTWEESHQFLKNLLDCNNNWVLACKPCHKTKSYAEKMSIDFSEAQMLKEVIRIDKEESVDDIITFCEDYGFFDNGSKKKRKKNVEAIFRSVE